jgi:predicted Na+-dependent transporter
MALGLLLAALLPTSGMTISWTGFTKGNMGAAINMTVIGLTLGSVATPFYVKGLLGAAVAVDIYKVMQQIVLIVFLPMGLGFLTRQFLLKKYGMGAFKERMAPRFPALSTIGVLVIALAYIIQVQSAAWYVRLTDSLFGQLPAVEQA